MARTAITLRNLTANGGIIAPTPTTIDQANGMTLAIPTNTIPSPSGIDRLVLVVVNTAGTTPTTTINAGVGGGAVAGQAFRSALGALVQSTPAGITYIGPFESSRFAALDGSLSIDFSSGSTGTITALLLPKNFG